jgi:hypothetical protein
MWFTLTGYIVSEVVKVFRSEYSISVKSLYSDMSIDDTVIVLNVSNFDIGVKFVYTQNESKPEVLLNLE